MTRRFKCRVWTYIFFNKMEEVSSKSRWLFGRCNDTKSQKPYFFRSKYLNLTYRYIKVHKYNINNCPARCNTKQSIYYSASSLYVFRVSTTPIIRSTQNCNYILRYCAATSLQRGQAWPRWREVARVFKVLASLY